MQKDEHIHDHMKLIANELNLRPHLVSDSATEMALCGDIEIHRLKSHLFGLDMARVFPPAFPLPEGGSPPSGSVFFRMLRPEFVKKYKPLSSDALSNWQISDRKNLKEMNSDVQEATYKLLEQCQIFSEQLIDKEKEKFIKLSLSIAKQPTFVQVVVKDEIINNMHQNGINTRYLGQIVLNIIKISKDHVMVNFLFGLMTSRILKNIWRKKIREKQGNKLISMKFA